MGIINLTNREELNALIVEKMLLVIQMLVIIVSIIVKNIYQKI